MGRLFKTKAVDRIGTRAVDTNVTLLLCCIGVSELEPPSTAYSEI